MGQELTTANKILLAASRLDEENETFTAEDLIVKAWNEYPESFGLTGYRERYPDSNRVLSKLMGSVGLCSRGWLEQMSTKLYRMTPAGRKFAQALRDAPPSNDASLPGRPARARTPIVREAATPRTLRAVKEPAPDATPEAASPPPSPPAARVTPTPPEVRPVPAARAVEPSPRVKEAPAPVPAPTPAPVAAVAIDSAKKPVPAPPSRFEGLATLQRLVMSVASQKFTRGGLVTFADACSFWGIAPANPTHLNARMIEIDALLKRAESEVQATAASIRVHDRLEVSLTTVIGLQGLHRMLRQKYQRELDAMKARAGD